MAEHITTRDSEPREHSFPCVERQLQLEDLDKGDQNHVLALVAWAILSAAYSADGEASADFLNLEAPQTVVQIRFHLDAGHSVQSVFDQVQRKLESGNDDHCSTANISNDVQETAEVFAGLPLTLVTRKMDATVHKLVSQGNYALAIALEVDMAGNGKTVLKSCYSNRVDNTDLDLLQTRVRDLISQFHDERDYKIQQLNFITTFDKQQLRILNEPMPPTVHAFAHELIKLQARSHPRKEAICAWDGSLTYEELDRRAVCLAKNLVQRGVSLGSWVPLLFEKSKWHIVSMLAVRRLISSSYSCDTDNGMYRSSRQALHSLR